ncbi:hypothetical protein ONZ45_g18093 [Pleurotus djamor]|nr:hypothetical protein ONZ45_g18093 [Pleurotus djamor]
MHSTQRSEPCPPAPPPKPQTHSSRLLYLTNHGGSLAWRAYSATLTTDGISLVPALSTGAVLDAHVIAFDHCIDVRAGDNFNEQLDQHDPLLRDAPTPGNLRPFELVFEGRPLHRFACFTSQDRAIWIDLIWESILSLHEKAKGRMTSIPSERIRHPQVAADPYMNQSPPFQQAYSFQQEETVRPQSQISQVQSFLDVGKTLLPPLVIANGCPSLTTSACTSTAPSSTRSPSIANLGALSVVKNRISQLERQGSYDSSIDRSSRTSKAHHPNLLDNAGDNILDYYTNKLDGPVSPLESVTLTNERPGSSDIAPTKLAQATAHSPTANHSRNTATDDLLKDLCAKVEHVLKYCEKQVHSTPSSTELGILATLKEISTRLEDTRRQHDLKFDGITSNIQRNANQGVPELNLILQKIDQLQQSRLHGSQELGAAKPNSHEANANTDKLITLIQAELSDRAAQYQQQVDSVRYLSELNTWLENFVTNGTSQIQAVAANVDHLCQTLCYDTSPNTGLRHDVQQILAEGRSREHTMKVLQSNMNMNSGLHQQAQITVAAPTEMINDIIAHQRREHETMLATFVQEITREIRGERLRFVEAMKEATAINVQKK